MIYILNIFVVDPACSGHGLSSRENKVFYLSSSDEVCEVMSQIPKDHYVSLSVCSFSSVDEVLTYVKNGCRSSKSFRD